MANHNALLSKHLQYSKKNATYTSKSTQNGIIQIVGQYIRKDILKGLQGRGFYSIIADEVTDKFANQEVLALCLRFLDDTQPNPIIREEFFEFVHLQRTTGEAISSKIIDILRDNEIPIDKMRGQAYDGAAAMSSEKQGVQGRIKAMNKLALYTHCKSHVLNLSIAHACKLPLVRNMVDGINSTYIFFESSPKRQQYFEDVLSHQETESSRTKLLGLCKTRWVERHTCFNSFYSMYDSIVKCLQYMLNPTLDDHLQVSWTWDAQTKITAQGLLSTMTSFQFLVTFICVKAVLETVRPLASKLQKRDLDLFEAANLIDDRIQRVKEMRSEIDTEFGNWYDDSKRIADELDIEVKKPRMCNRQAHRSNVNSSADPCEYYKTNIAIPFWIICCWN